MTGAALASAVTAASLSALVPARSPRVHEVRMAVIDGDYRFDPARLSVARGDTVIFTVASGEPHNVAFDTTTLDGAAREAVRHVIPDPIQPFAGALLSTPGARFVLPTGTLPAGTYPFYCMPHLALQMTGVLTVK